MKKIFALVVVFLLLVSMFSVISQIKAVGSEGFEVVCVPWRGDENLPHPTYEGKEITLKGTVRYEGTVSWEWDFGDGAKQTGTATTTDDYPYPISAKHTYMGAVGTTYVARLTVTAGGDTKSDTYLVKIEENSRKVKAEVAVDEGLWWLYQQQYRYTSGGVDYGYWYTSYRVAHTSAAVQAFENNLHKPYGDPSKDPYVDAVRRGLNFIISRMSKVSIPANDGDTNGNGFGIACYDSYWVEMYEIGMAMMAIVSSDTPGRIAIAGPDGVIGRTYRDIVQDMADFCAYAQNGPETGFYEGGWRYSRNYGSSDNSVTQWPIMGMEPAEKKWGIVIADFVKPRLEGWLNRTQCKIADWRFGGFGYTSATEWVNIAKTAGTGIPGFIFCGVPETDPRIVNAINFIDSNWATDNFGNGYAMYAVMKAFEEFLPRESTGSHIWWNEYVDYLIPLQRAGGYWDTMSYAASPQLTTAWMVMILTKVVYDIPPTAVAKANGFDEVKVDKNQTVYFDGSMSKDGTYKIVKYEWDFESDGTYDAEGAKVTHSFPEYGNYIVTLRVTDNRDVVTGGKKPAMSHTDTCIVYVHPPPHPPIADANGPYIGWVGVPVTLDGSGSWDPNQPPFGSDEILSWLWDLDNDGEYNDAYGKIVEYTWNQPGTYPIALWVRAKEEPRDCLEPSRTLVKIGNHDPVANAGGPYKTQPCRTIKLDGSRSYDPDEPVGDRIVSYEWDLDNDGEYDDAFVVNPEFHRDTEGVYIVRIKVKDSLGATSVDWTTVTVEKEEEWSFAIITDLHVGRGYPDYGADVKFDKWGNIVINEEGYKDKGTIGQNYYLTKRLKEIVDWIKNEGKSKYNIKFVVILGDIANDGEYSELEMAKKILDGLEDIPYFPVIGNHDVWVKVGTIPVLQEKDYGDKIFKEVFNETFLKLQFGKLGVDWYDIHEHPLFYNYAFSYGGIDFVSLDFVWRGSAWPPVAWIYRETKEWFEEQLYKEGRKVVLFSHHPMVIKNLTTLIPIDLMLSFLPWKAQVIAQIIEISAELAGIIEVEGEIVKYPYGFLPKHFRLIEEIINKARKDYNTEVTANFAGHIHGGYNYELGGIPGLEELPDRLRQLFMDANVNYTEKGCPTPAGISVVTTEALMVGSNEPLPKDVVRIVKIKGDKISKCFTEGEPHARALNPYFREVDPEEFGGITWGLKPYIRRVVEFEVIAHTKRFTNENPGKYALDFGDGVCSLPVESRTWTKGIKFKHEYMERGKYYNVTLIAEGTTPGCEPIRENLTWRIYVPPPSKAYFGLLSQADMIVTDPDGLIISKELNEVPGARYIEEDLNRDGELDDLITIPYRKIGDYFITIIPEPNAESADTYTLLFWPEYTDEAFILAENVQICNTPQQPYIVRSTATEIIPIIPATIDFNPDTLNLKNKGDLVTVYIELPVGHGYDVGMINLSTVMLNGQVYAETKPFAIGDYDRDGVPDLMVKFNRVAVQSILSVGDQVKITISGKLTDGRLFEGADTIKVILPTKTSIPTS